MAANKHKSFSRKDRVSEQVRRELAELIRTELKDPRVGMVSITDVEVTPDYAHAKVWFKYLKVIGPRRVHRLCTSGGNATDDASFEPVEESLD